MVCFLYRKRKKEVNMKKLVSKSFDLKDIYDTMNEDGYVLETGYKEQGTLILYDVDNMMIVGRTNIINPVSNFKKYIVKDYQNKFDDAYESKYKQPNTQYRFEVVPVSISSVVLKYSL